MFFPRRPSVILPCLVLTLARPALADECTGAPDGMRCVTAANANVGEGDAARTVALARFFVDPALVTNAQYAACVKADACAPAGGKADAAARVDWVGADHYCAFAGKRMASEAELEATFAALAAVGAPSIPTGGKNTEWSKTWFTAASTCDPKGTASAPLPKYTKDWLPPALCGSADVMDACDGAVLCGTLGERVVKDAATPTKRAKAGAHEGAAAHAFRCATSTPYLTRFPSRFNNPAKGARARPPDLTAPTADQLAIVKAIEEDTLDVPPCDKVGRSFIDCRDPRSYLKSNEPKLAVLVPYVENMGGAYTGVGSDQNYTFVALARSRWAFLFDYDWNVVRWHHVLRSLILASPDRNAFVAQFDAKNTKTAAAIVAQAYAGDADADNLVALFKSSAANLRSHYASQTKESYTWLGSDEHYAYVKTMYAQGRMRALRGNMLDVHAMQTIGAATKKLGDVMRIYYPSNAAEFWPFTEQYRKNVRNLPIDDDSVVVQTISGISLKSGFGQTGYWHYNVQYAREQQLLLALPGYTREKQLLNHRVKSESTELTLCGMPE